MSRKKYLLKKLKFDESFSTVNYSRLTKSSTIITVAFQYLKSIPEACYVFIVKHPASLTVLLRQMEKRCPDCGCNMDTSKIFASKQLCARKANRNAKYTCFNRVEVVYTRLKSFKRDWNWTPTELSYHDILSFTQVQSERSRYNMTFHIEKTNLEKFITATQKNSTLL